MHPGISFSSINRSNVASATPTASETIRRTCGEALKDPRHPPIEKAHPDHGRLVRETEGLYGSAYPG